MELAGKPANEQQRLSALYEYNILDTLPEKEFDDIVRIASEICDTPISSVTIIDSDRQWFKSRKGLESQETPRDISFCGHAILHPDEVFTVADSHSDARFVDNPFVIGSPGIVFYAGVPLVTDTGYALGTICVIDNRPRELNDQQKTTLKALANQVVRLLELRKKSAELEKANKEVKETNAELERFAYVAAHDLKSPCNNVIGLAGVLRDGYAGKLDADGMQIIDHMEYAMHSLKQLVDGILRHSAAAHSLKPEKELFTFSQLMKDVQAMVRIPQGFIFYFNASDDVIYTPKASLQQILLNLCDNAVKYNNKEQAFVKVIFNQDEQYYHFTVTDNGVGIAEKDKEKVFNLFHTLNTTDRFENKGTGIGLSTVQKLVEKLDGKLRLTSEVGVGTSFTVSIHK